MAGLRRQKLRTIPALELEAIEILRTWRHLRSSGAAVSEDMLRCVDRAVDLVLQLARRAPEGDERLSIDVLESLEALFGDRSFLAREAIRMSWERKTPAEQRTDLALREMAKARGAPLTSRVVGEWFKHHAGRVHAGRVLTRAGRRENSALWRILRK
jgi:hypothetical protein